MSKEIPFKADSVGSFLRTKELKEAREKLYNNEITKEELRKIEDVEILKLIEKQKKHGLTAITDGEFRRRWHLDFLEQINGISKYTFPPGPVFQGIIPKRPPEGYYVSDKISFNPSHTFLDDFKFLKDSIGEGYIAKQTIPGPCKILNTGVLLSDHYDKNPVYDSLDDLCNDIVKVYQDAIQAFYDAGCRYLQLDDTAWGALYDNDDSKKLEAKGHKIEDLIDRFGELTERAISKKPKNLAITFHTCRGNFRSSWRYEGTYNSIAERLFKIENIDGFFLEYDTERAGDFTPLKYLKKQKVVLGLVTSKHPELEPEEILLQRIKEASKYVPIEQICISPQCGFASTEDGNDLTEEDQWKKIDLVVSVSKKF